MVFHLVSIYTVMNNSQKTPSACVSWMRPSPSFKKSIAYADPALTQTDPVMQCASIIPQTLKLHIFISTQQ